MTLVPYEKSKVGYAMYKMSKNQKLLNEFVESGLDCAQVNGFTTQDATTCAASLNASIKRFKIAGIRAISRKGCVYLVRED